MILMAALFSLLFLGGWLAPLVLTLSGFFWFSIKTTIMCFFFIFVRSNFPRFRFDQLMILGWKVLMPLSLLFLINLIGILFLFDGLPVNINCYSSYKFDLYYNTFL
jgi:NADH-quinone oxidoreductase subunit H